MRLNKKIKQKGREVVDLVEQLTDAYQNLFKWWINKAFAGIEPEVMSESQIDMCLQKAKELYNECYNRKG
jgi:hypothetical protein